MDRKDKGAQQPPTARKLLDSSARRSIVSPHEKDKMQRPMPEQSKESLVNPPHGILAAEALKAPRKISRAAKIMGGIALSTVGVTAAAAAGPHHSSSQRSSPVLPGAGHAAKQNSPAEYKVSTGPQCQIVVVFDEPPVRPDILQLLAELQHTTRNQQSSAEFTGWGTRTLTITVKLTAATALIKAVEHFIVEILKIRGTREITGKVGDEEIRIKGTNDIAQLREALEQLQARHVTLHAWNEGNCRYFRATL